MSRDLLKVLMWCCGLLAVASANATGSHAQKAHEYELHGRVVYTDDGDTFMLLDDSKTQFKIRLASIDAPETAHTKREKGRVGQPYGEKSKQHLAKLVHGRPVDLHCYEKDLRDRDVCDVRVDGTFVNAEMVESGWAWANQAAGGRYLRAKSFVQLEAEAKAAKRGVWAGRNPIEPWTWRQRCWKGGDCPQ